jgi:hypothetical protein
VNSKNTWPSGACPQSFSAPFSVAENALEAAPMRYWLTKMALRSKRKSLRNRGWGRKLVVWMLDALVFRRFMQQMGGRIKRILVLSDATLNYMDHHLERRVQVSNRAVNHAFDLIACTVW